MCIFFFSSRRRHTRFKCDWSSDVCSSDLMNGLDTATIDQAGHFHTAVVGQVLDQAEIGHVAVDHLGTIERVPFDDLRPMIKAAFKEECALTEALALQVVAQRSIMLCAIQWARSRALPAREVEAPADIRLEQLFALAKIGDIFGNKPARFMHERSKLAQHL